MITGNQDSLLYFFFFCVEMSYEIPAATPAPTPSHDGVLGLHSWIGNTRRPEISLKALNDNMLLYGGVYICTMVL